MGSICRKNDGALADSGVAPKTDAGTSPGTDTTAPVVSITSPTPNSQVAASTTVVATATDDVGVDNVELLVDSVAFASKSTAPYSFSIALQPGSHTLTVVAYDKAKNKGQASVSVTVGGAAPQTDGGAPPPPKPDAGGTIPPPQPGGNNPFGNGCNAATDCLTQVCAFDPALNAKYCSQACGVQDWCPPGGVCIQGSASSRLCALQLSGQGGTTPQGGATGGCSLDASDRAASAGTFASILLGLLGLGLLRRRRRR